MSTIIKVTDLKEGDILLYHGTSFISELIRLFDGSTYSHASIYDGSNIAEAIPSGVIKNSVDQSIKSAEFVDVFRFHSETGQELGNPNYSVQPIIKRISYYLAQGDRYAYEEIILLAFLTATRRLPINGWIPGLGRILRTIMDNATNVVNKMIAAGKEPMICSELDYRCYVEAGEKYRIKIVGADQLMQFGIHDSLARGIIPLTGAERGDQEAQQLIAATQVFLHRLAVGRKTESRLLAVSDFVTPRDLADSPNLVKVGRFKG